MKLKERLEQLDPQTIVFLGSATSCFDVNRAGYMREEKYLNELSKQEKEKLKKSAVSTLKTAKYKLLNPRSVIECDEEKIDKAKLSEVKRMAQRHKNSVEVALRSATNAQQIVDRFEPIADREVKSELVRTAIDGATLIVVTGDEQGKYWFINEKYKSGEVPLWEDKKDE